MEVKIFQIKITGVFIHDQRSFAHLCIKKLRKSMIDHDYFIYKIEQWKAEDPSAKFYFCPKCVAEKELFWKKIKLVVKTKIVTTKMTTGRYH